MLNARRIRLNAVNAEPMGPELSQTEYVQKALEQFRAFSPIPGVVGPYLADSLVWKHIRYYYVYARDTGGARRLIEVFVVNQQRQLEPVLAFQYPTPFRTLFPNDYALLHSDDPWGDTAPANPQDKYPQSTATQ